MRIIKFRAWDILSKSMVGEDYLWSIPYNEIFIHTPDSRCIELMQFTGLHDKNGKEIYEGDILRMPAKTEWEKTSFNSFEIFYHDNDCSPTDCGLVLGRLRTHGNSAGGYSGYKLIPKNVSVMEVIGNIYENPELLKW